MKKKSSPEICVFQVMTPDCLSVWPKVEDLIESGMDRVTSSSSRPLEYSIEHVKHFVVTGQWMLLVAVDRDGGLKGAATVSFIDYPLKRAAFLTTISGNFIVNKDCFDQLKEVLKKAGAKSIQGIVSKSVARLYSRLGIQGDRVFIESEV